MSEQLEVVEGTSSDSELRAAQDFLSGILTRMKIGHALQVEEEDDKFVLEIECERDGDVSRLTGRRGQLVDALQHLVGKKLARVRDGRGKPVIVDVGGFRRRHVERLESLAEKMADKCRETGEAVRLRPMTPFDRRVVHMALAEVEDVTTESEGEGEDRHIVVHPA